MTKKLVWAVAVVALVVGGGAYVYGSELPIFDALYSPEQQELRQVQRLAKEFPAAIGTYALYGQSPEKIQVRKECVPPESQETCYRNITAEYRQTDGHKVVFVHISKAANEGGEALKAFVTKEASPDTLGTYGVVRVEQHELGWFPLAGYDVVMTQEGVCTPNERGTVDCGYPARATGANPVTQYFIERYPPAPASEAAPSS
jgi:hypothetical protein